MEDMLAGIIFLFIFWLFVIVLICRWVFRINKIVNLLTKQKEIMELILTEVTKPKGSTETNR